MDLCLKNSVFLENLSNNKNVKFWHGNIVTMSFIANFGITIALVVFVHFYMFLLPPPPTTPPPLDSMQSKSIIALKENTAGCWFFKCRMNPNSQNDQNHCQSKDKRNICKNILHSLYYYCGGL